MIPAKVRKALYERAGNSCERCGVSNAYTYSAHHRRPRGMGGSSDPATDTLTNLVLLCGSGTTGCHGWTESQRTESYVSGYLVRQSNDPADEPIVYRGQWVYLLPDGAVEPVVDGAA